MGESNFAFSVLKTADTFLTWQEERMFQVKQPDRLDSRWNQFCETILHHRNGTRPARVFTAQPTREQKLNKTEVVH